MELRDEEYGSNKSRKLKNERKENRENKVKEKESQMKPVLEFLRWRPKEIRIE